MKYLICASIILAIGNGHNHGGLLGCPANFPADSDCSRCASTNDPHVTTFDGVKYDQHTEDCFQYVVECDWTQPPNTVPFEICGCHYDAGANPPNGPANIGDVNIKFFDAGGNVVQSAQISHNTAFDAAGVTSGNTYNFGPALAHSFDYNNAAGLHTFAISGGGGLFYAYIRYQSGNLQIYLDDYFQNDVCGLCGWFDGNPGDDFKGSDSVQYMTPAQTMAMNFWNSNAPPFKTKINNFADTYLCDDSEELCFETATVCCEEKLKKLGKDFPWKNELLNVDEWEKEWIDGCVVDVCALTNNDDCSDCQKLERKQPNPFEFAEKLFIANAAPQGNVRAGENINADNKAVLTPP